MTALEPAAIWAVLLIVNPLASAIIAFLMGRVAVALAIVNAVLMIVAAFGLLDAVSARPLTYAIGGWGAPLGIELYADSLSGALIAGTSVVILAVTIYAPGYLSRTGCRASFWPLVFFLQAALNGLFLSADIFNLYVALEVLSLSGVALVALGDKASALHAALRYLMASLVASLCYLLGVALLYHAHGALDLATLADSSRDHGSPWAALGRSAPIAMTSPYAQTLLMPTSSSAW